MSPSINSQEVSVFAPATIANLSCGYDVLGLAIDGPGDRVVLRHTPDSKTKGLSITQITGDEGKLTLDPFKNTAGVSALSVLKSLGAEEESFEMEIHKQMPFGSGLGSSAASAVAGAFAVNALFGEPLSKVDLIEHAMAGEALASGAFHADNVAPCILGNITLIHSNSPLEVLEIESPKNFYLSVVYPHLEILTKEARNLVPKMLPVAKATQQAAHLGGLIAGLYSGDFNLIGKCLEDQIAEPNRKDLITGFDEAQDVALNIGAVGFGISGSGPSVYAISEGKQTAEQVTQCIAEVFEACDLKCETFTSGVNPNGATILSRR